MASNIPFEYQTEFGQADELEKLAQLIAMQRAKSQPQGQMVSGHYVRASPMQHLADLFSAYNQGFASKQAAAMRQAATKRMAGDERGQIAQIAQMMTGKPIETVPGDFGPGERETIGSQTYEAPRPRRAEETAFMSPFPRVQKLGERLQKNRHETFSVGARSATPESVIQAQGDYTQLQPQQPEMYGNVGEIPGLKTPEGKPIYGQQNLKTQKWGELGTDRAPKQNVTVLGGSQEKPYITEAQTGMAKTDLAMFNSALQAHEANQSLGRIKGFLAEGAKVTGGPLAQAEVFVRNLAAEWGFPLNKALDRGNTMLSAEFTSRIASQVLSGGRGISNDDRVALEAAFPSFKTGIPAEMLPTFIAQLEAINNSKIGMWQARWRSLPPDFQKQYPATFGNRDVPQSPGGWTPEKQKRLEELEAKANAGTLR